MGDRWVEIAGLTLAFHGPEGKEVDLPSPYKNFTTAGRSADCHIRVRVGPPDLQGHLHLERSVFRSRDLWGVYRQEGGWTFVYPLQDDHSWKRFLHWTPPAEVGVWIPAGEPLHNPLGDITLPFFAALFARHRGILLHAAAVQVHGRAWIFAGPGGSGKSHWAHLWHEAGLTVLHEDRIILRERGEDVWAFGTPLHVEPRLCSPEGAPVERIYFLQMAAPDAIVPAGPARAAALLLRSAVLPIYDAGAMGQLLEVAGRAATQAETFLLGRASDEFAEALARQAGEVG